MSRTLRLIYSIALLAVMSASAWAQAHITWAEEWEAALSEAKARNVPLHVAIHKDG